MTVRPRVLVAVEPLVLSEVLLSLLAAIDLDDVVTTTSEGELDAAIVSADAEPSSAPLVIEVPGSDAAGWGAVHDRGATTAVRLATATALLALLDERLRASQPRTERIDRLIGQKGASR